jgi:hypothetical protein
MLAHNLQGMDGGEMKLIQVVFILKAPRLIGCASSLIQRVMYKVVIAQRRACVWLDTAVYGSMSLISSVQQECDVHLARSLARV